MSKVAQEAQVRKDGTLAHDGLGKARQTLLTRFTFATSDPGRMDALLKLEGLLKNLHLLLWGDGYFLPRVKIIHCTSDCSLELCI